MVIRSYNTDHGQTTSLCGHTILQYRPRSNNFTVWSYDPTIQTMVKQLHCVVIRSYNTDHGQTTSLCGDTLVIQSYNTDHGQTTSLRGHMIQQYRPRSNNFTMWSYDTTIQTTVKHLHCVVIQSYNTDHGQTTSLCGHTILQYRPRSNNFTVWQACQVYPFSG